MTFFSDPVPLMAAYILAALYIAATVWLFRQAEWRTACALTRRQYRAGVAYYAAGMIMAILPLALIINA